MSMELVTLRITGTSPLMMHSDRLANPLNPATKAHKELTGKRKKTDDDHLAIARSEFIAGAYYDEKLGFYIPGANFDATFLAGAKLQKLGVQPLLARWLYGGESCRRSGVARHGEVRPAAARLGLFWAVNSVMLLLRGSIAVLRI